MEDKINILPMAGGSDMDYFAMVYQFALNKLKDHDGVFNIRRYFKNVLWPEKKQSR